MLLIVSLGPGIAGLESPYERQSNEPIRETKLPHDRGAGPEPHKDEDEGDAPSRKGCCEHVGTEVAVVQVGHGRPRGPW